MGTINKGCIMSSSEKRQQRLVHDKVSGYLSGCRHFRGEKRKMIVQHFVNDYKDFIMFVDMIESGMSPFKAINDLVFGR